LVVLSNRLFYGDNLDVMRERIPTESVDLVYLDPPFNSNRNYNVIFGRHEKTADTAAAQIQAFGDTWVWTPVSEQQYISYVSGELPATVADALSAFHTLLGENDAMAYLVNMAPRLVQLHRVLKPTGVLYLHCDPTMSHYLKVMLDAVFGAPRFMNEIIWKRYGAHNDHGQGSKHFGRVHDSLLVYGKTEQFKWKHIFVPYEADYIAQEYRRDDGDGRGRYTLKPMTAPGGAAKGNPGVTVRPLRQLLLAAGDAINSIVSRLFNVLSQLRRGCHKPIRRQRGLSGLQSTGAPSAPPWVTRPCLVSQDSQSTIDARTIPPR
jgi:hypothetical protein